MAFGSSGTIKAIHEVLIGQGPEDGLITFVRLSKLIENLCEWDSIDDLQLPGLTDDRKPVFAAGDAILSAIFHALNIKEMHFRMVLCAKVCCMRWKIASSIPISVYARRKIWPPNIWTI